MNTLLTLVIALGGIATGIGAIWAAIVARRQAQLTERSLTEQNERSRLTLEFDLLTRLEDRSVSPHFLSRRRAASKYLLDNAFVEDDDDLVEVPPLNPAAIDVCRFYEEVGDLVSVGVLSAESAWDRFGVLAQSYWLVCKPAIEKMREEVGFPMMYGDFEHLCRLLADIDRERGIAAPTQERLRQLMEEEAVRGEEPPTTTTE
jgi:hypothetical protein